MLHRDNKTDILGGHDANNLPIAFSEMDVRVTIIDWPSLTRTPSSCSLLMVHTRILQFILHWQLCILDRWFVGVLPVISRHSSIRHLEQSSYCIRRSSTIHWLLNQCHLLSTSVIGITRIIRCVAHISTSIYRRISSRRCILLLSAMCTNRLDNSIFSIHIVTLCSTSRLLCRLSSVRYACTWTTSEYE